MKENWLVCHTDLNPLNKKSPLKTVCHWRGERYARKVSRNRTERQNVKDIANYIQDRHGEDAIENVQYKDIGLG